MNLPNNTYTFGNFRFESDNLILRYDKKPLSGLSLQPLKVLAVFLSHEGVVNYDVILKEAWPEEKQAKIDDTNIKPHISALRKIFVELDPEREYIQTFPSRGYLFVGAKLESEIDVPNEGEPAETFLADSTFVQHANLPAAEEIGLKGLVLNGTEDKRRSKLNSIVFWGAAGLLALAFGIFVWMRLSTPGPKESGRVLINSPIDEELIRNVVRESQNYETLIVYSDPSALDEQSLRQFFVDPADGGQEPQKIRKAVDNLIQKGLHYGSESRSEVFNFTSIRLYSPGDYAEIETEESWYIPAYRNDGTRSMDTKIRLQVKPTYYLKKIRGRWLIEENTTARKKPSTPQ